MLGIPQAKRYTGEECDLKAGAVDADPCRAVRPDGSDDLEPLFQDRHESPRPRVLDAAKLADETVVTEDRDLLLGLSREASVRRGRKHFHGFEISWTFSPIAAPSRWYQIFPPDSTSSARRAGILCVANE